MSYLVLVVSAKRSSGVSIVELLSVLFILLYNTLRFRGWDGLVDGISVLPFFSSVVLISIRPVNFVLTWCLGWLVNKITLSVCLHIVCKSTDLRLTLKGRSLQKCE